MAADNSRTFAPGVRVTEYPSGNVYFGSAEALVSAGLICANQLPGQPGMAKFCVTFYGGELVGRGKHSTRDENYLYIQKTGKKFTVTQGVSKVVEAERWSTEREAERVAAAAKRETEGRSQIAKAKAEYILYFMVNSADEHRQKMIKGLRSHIGDLRSRDMLPNENHGFSMNESTAAELNELLGEMIELISNADVLFNAKRHTEINYKCRIDVARGDQGFQRTLESFQQSAHID